MRLTASTFPRLLITRFARQKIHNYARAAVGEVAGLGEVVEYPGLLLVQDVFLVSQIASTASAELDSDALANLTVALAERGNLDRIRFFFHSHGDMGCYFSGTDDFTIEAFRAPYLISTVVNKRGEEAHRLDVFEPFRISIQDVRIATIDSETLREIAELEVEQLVCERAFSPVLREEEDRDV